MGIDTLVAARAKRVLHSLQTVSRRGHRELSSRGGCTYDLALLEFLDGVFAMV